MKKLSENFYIAPQIGLGDLEAIKAAGIMAIINNQTEHETPHQVPTDDMKKAVIEQGMGYYPIPIAGGQFSLDDVTTLQTLINDTQGPVLAYCLSGTRSAVLWMFANAPDHDIDELISSALQAGYNLGHLKPSLEAFKSRG